MGDKQTINALSSVVLSEVSLVDEPANPEAKVLIVKAKGKPDLCKDCKTPDVCKKGGKCAQEPDGDEMKKALAAINAALGGPNDEDSEMDLKELEGALEKSKTALETAAADLKARDAEIAKLKADLEKANKADGGKDSKGEASEEELMKSVPAEIRKRLEDAEKSAAASAVLLAKMADDREVAEAIAKAKADGLPEPDKSGAILHRLAKGASTADDAKEISRLLKAAGAQAKAGAALFKTIGSTAEDGEDKDPEALLKAKAEEIAKAEKIPFAKAYTMALEQNPDLYEAYVAKRR